MDKPPRLLARALSPLWARLLFAVACLWAAAALYSAALDAYLFYGGRFYDKTERYFQAAAALDRYVERRPRDPRACEAHLRAGLIYARRLDRCLEARRHFEAAARGFPGQACSARARAEIMDCPNFFPLDWGRNWVYGDTASRGRNMRLDWELLASSDAAKTPVLASLYAGKKRISVRRLEYYKRDWAVWEREAGLETMVLRYPFRAGSSWSVRRGNDVLNYRIDKDGLQVKTVAGTFNGCLKVRESNPTFRGSWKFDYYAPDVGRVKTTIGAPGVENPNTELIKYKVP